MLLAIPLPPPTPILLPLSLLLIQISLYHYNTNGSSLMMMVAKKAPIKWTTRAGNQLQSTHTVHLKCSSLKSLGSFNTVQDFWRYWNNLIDNTKPLPESSNLRMFKQGITPSWEHPANAQGGKWILQCQKDQTKRYFTSLVLSLIGDCLSFCDEVCGIVLSTRTTTDSISLWNTNAENSTLIEKYTSEISELLSLHSNPNVSLEYKPHQVGILFFSFQFILISSRLL